MNYIYLGKFVNTHGIKGEIRILSDFERKNEVFKPKFNIYFGPKKEKYIIKSYRTHKNYDMVNLQDITNINDIEKYKGLNVYINRDDLNLDKDDFILQDLIGLKVYENDVLLGKINDYMYNNANILLQVQGIKDFYIPYVDKYIKKIDIKNNKVYVENIRGLIL